MFLVFWQDALGVQVVRTFGDDLTGFLFLWSNRDYRMLMRRSWKFFDWWCSFFCFVDRCRFNFFAFCLGTLRDDWNFFPSFRWRFRRYFSRLGNTFDRVARLDT